MLHPPRPCHFGDVNKALDSGLELDKGAVIGHVDNAPDHAAIYWVALINALPRIGRELFEPKRDPLFFAIKLQDFDGDLITGVNNFGRMADAAVRHVRNMQEPVDSSQINESSV